MMPLAYLLIHSAPNMTLKLCKSLKLMNGVVETYTLLNWTRMNYRVRISSIAFHS